jgi:hypothetical protein
LIVSGLVDGLLANSTHTQSLFFLFSNELGILIDSFQITLEFLIFFSPGWTKRISKYFFVFFLNYRAQILLPCGWLWNKFLAFQLKWRKKPIYFLIPSIISRVSRVSVWWLVNNILRSFCLFSFISSSI